MTLHSNVAGLVAHWKTTSAGYNAAASRFEDQSGAGNHMALDVGTPDLAQTKDGHTGWKMHGDCYFQFKDRLGYPANLMPAEFTVVQVLHANLQGADQFFPFYMSYRAFDLLGDPAWETPTDTALGVSSRAIRARLLGGNLTFWDPTFGVTPSVPFTSNQWNVFVYVWCPIGGFRKAAVNTHIMTDDGGAPSQQRTHLANDEVRLGIKSDLGTITTTSGESMTSLQGAVWQGDVTGDPAFASLIAALVADPSAT